jgi:hypothetical protein
MANKSYKGRRFEIWLAGVLSRWWSRGKRDDIFWHTHDSGGRATKRTKRGLSTTNLYGDICAVDLVGVPLLKVFTIEAKKGYSQRGTLHHMIDRKPRDKPYPYEEWIPKLQGEAKAAGSLGWLLIHRRDQKQATALWYLPDVCLSGSRLGDAGTTLRLTRNGVTCLLESLSDFLRRVSPIEIRRILHYGKTRVEHPPSKLPKQEKE